ncbi:coiled-coil domain-containing protein 173-like [Cheilinus undulatus]|uniref:coiled-coil domain-containing protein 173-like n=1 Tax=Cheilinus undulatus TaxID=241271 RepID=UPI001BD6AED2|nr:coiled-coil domain-containing protein 173-like [Cheilinus undulatus]
MTTEQDDPKNKTMRTLQEQIKQEREDFFNKVAQEEMEQKRSDSNRLLDRARSQIHLSRDRVRKFNSHLMASYVNEENKALIKLRREQQKNAQAKERQLGENLRLEAEEALREEQQKSHLQKQQILKHVEANKERVEDKKQKSLKEMQAEKEEGARLKRLDDLHAQAQKQQALKAAELQSTNHKERLHDITEKNLHREKEAEKLKLQDLKTMRDQVEIQWYQRQKKIDHEKLLKQRQETIDAARASLASIKEKKAASLAMREEADWAKKQAELRAVEAEKQKEMEQRKAQLIKSCFADRESKMARKEQEKKAEKESDLAWIQAEQRADKKFHEEEKQRAQLIREKNIRYRDENTKLIAERQALRERQRKEEQKADWKIARSLAEQDREYENYVQSELDKAAGTQRFALLNAKHAQSDLRPTCLPCISTPQPPVEDPRSPPRTECSPYCSADVRSPLLRYSTEETRVTKLNLERNKLQLTYKEYKDHLQQPLPPISTRQTPAGAVCPPSGRVGSSFCSNDKRERLPLLQSKPVPVVAKRNTPVRASDKEGQKKPCPPPSGPKKTPARRRSYL